MNIKHTNLKKDRLEVVGDRGGGGKGRVVEGGIGETNGVKVLALGK